MPITPVSQKSQSKDVRLNTVLGDYKRKINEIIEEYEVVVQDKEPTSPSVGTVWVDTSTASPPLLLTRVDITDFWDSPFWGSIPDKPSTFPPSSHEHAFLNLTDTPASYSGEGEKSVRVKVTEDGLEFYTLIDTDEKVKVGSGGVADYLNENYFERDVSNHIRIKQNTLLTGVDVEKVGGELVADIVTDARVKAHFPDTIANILSDHDLGSHTALGLFDEHSDVDHDQTTNFNAAEHFLQSAITTVGTIATGTWEGDAIANAYIAGINQNLLTTSSPTLANLYTTTNIYPGNDVNRYIYSGLEGGGGAYHFIGLKGNWDTLMVKGRMIGWTGSNLHIGGYDDIDHSAHYIELAQSCSHVNIAAANGLYMTGTQVIDASRNINTPKVTIGSYYLNSLIANNKVPDSDKLEGYHGASVSTVNTYARRDGSGDINTRLFRSEYDTTNPTIGFIMTQIDTVSNNYIRPSTPQQLATALSPYLGVSFLGARAYRSGSQSIPGSTTTKILFNAESYDVGSDFQADGIGSWYTCPSAGYYFVYAQATFDSLNNAVYYDINIEKEASTVAFMRLSTGFATGYQTINISDVIYCASGNKITASVRHNHPAARNIAGTSYNTFICVRKVGD